MKMTQFFLNATFLSEEGADPLMWLAFREKLKEFAEKNGFRLEDEIATHSRRNAVSTAAPSAANEDELNGYDPVDGAPGVLEVLRERERLRLKDKNTG